MIIYLPTNEKFETRLELKKYLGGNAAYNKALKQGLILFNNVSTKGANDLVFLND